MEIKVRDTNVAVIDENRKLCTRNTCNSVMTPTYYQRPSVPKW